MSSDPTPQPQPQPSPPKPTGWIALAILLGCAMISLAIFCRPTEPAAPRSATFIKLGKDYGVTLTRSYADSLDLAGDEIGAGKPIADAQKHMQEHWTQERVAAWQKSITPALNAVCPEGSDPSQDQRQQLAVAFHDLAKGVRGADQSVSHWLGR